MGRATLAVLGNFGVATTLFKRMLGQCASRTDVAADFGNNFDASRLSSQIRAQRSSGYWGFSVNVA